MRRGPLASGTISISDVSTLKLDPMSASDL